jgi:FkbM family methyltransferase
MRDSLKYYVRAKTTDRGIVETVVIKDEYKLRKLNLRNSTIIDIGGQNGYFSVFASKYAHNIYIYEPIPDNFKIILKNIDLNNLSDKVHPFNLAVSDKEETLKIFLSKNNTGGHSIYGQGNNFIEFKAVTLSKIFEKNKIEKCDLLKMDVKALNIIYYIICQ